MSVCHYDGNATPRTHMEILGALADVIHTFYDVSMNHNPAQVKTDLNIEQLGNDI